MKILILTNLFPTPWDPARGAYNRQQFQRLGQKHEIDVVTAVAFRERWRRTRGEVSVTGLRTGHFVFVYPPRFGRSLHAACWLLSLLLQHGRKIRAARYDCVLASWAYPDAVAAGWLARRLGIPYLVKVHGSDLNVLATHALRRPQIRAALRGASAVVAVSHALADKVTELGVDRSRVHVVYNGVDHAVFAPGSRSEARVRLGLCADTPLLLYVGNLKSSKGCLDLLEAFPAVLAARPRARLVYVGAGPVRATLLARATELGCANHLQLVGEVAHADLVHWFRAADLLCLPSHNEGVPNVVLEAMACGTPVVASNVGGIPEVVPEYAGTLVPPRAVEALSTALVQATGRAWDSARITTHAAGFRWEDNISQVDHILHAVVAASSVPVGEPA